MEALVPAAVMNVDPSHTSSTLFSVFHLVIPSSGVKLGCSAVVPAGIFSAGPMNFVVPYNVFLITKAAPALF